MIHLTDTEVLWLVGAVVVLAIIAVGLALELAAQ
jgi:hypothetical protein